MKLAMWLLVFYAIGSGDRIESPERYVTKNNCEFVREKILSIDEVRKHLTAKCETKQKEKE